MGKEVNSKDLWAHYERDIAAQSEQFQIDTYYEPKKEEDKLRIAVVLEALSPQEGEKILDIGCGVGTFAFHSAKSGAYCTGADYSLNSVLMARKINNRYRLKRPADFVRADAMRLPFKSEVFDKVVCADFIEPINDKEKDILIREIKRVLKPKGIAVIFTPNAAREYIGEIYWRIRYILFRDKIPVTELHFGLTSKKKFEPLLKKYNFSFRLYYNDITRPFLARIQFIRNFLALNLLWVIKK
ncbi:MAG: methyltransferase domain-containing protein [Candidatus Omnitrophica bacterium]|nr:methyltransferase domain-containing protein [Candidatus Omnitrophota bacterium]